LGYQHRPLQPHRRINAIGAAYFVTSVTHERQEHFREPAFAELALCDLWFAAKLNQFSLVGYTILPEHVHLLARRTGKTTLSKFVGSFKRNIARDINDLIQERPHVRKSRAGADDSNRPLQENYLMTAKTHPWLTFQDYQSHFLWIVGMTEPVI
jgi:REP element-mobilizing transposase RayT